MPSADRSDSPDDREKDDHRGGSKKASSSSKAKDLSHVPCKFYKVGSCTAGSSCPFSHNLVEPGGQKDVCAWFVKGNCKFGHKCALAHILPGQTMAMDRKNKKAAQIAAGGAKNSSNNNTEQKGAGGSRGGGGKREGASAGGSNGRNALSNVASSRARPPMNMLKATISPSAPAPPLKDTEFASFGVLDESAPLPTAPARNKSPEPTPAAANPNAPKPPSPTLPVSAPRRPSATGTSPVRDYGPIGSPPSSATSPSGGRMLGSGHSGTPPATQTNGFLSTSPFSAPGTQSVFIGFDSSGPPRNKAGAGMGGMGMAASLGAGVGWDHPVSSSPLRASLLSSSVSNGIDISLEYEKQEGTGLGIGMPGRRRKTQQQASEDSLGGADDLQDFVPSSLKDLLTPEEQSRRMSRTNSGQSASGEGQPPPHHHHRLGGVGVPLGPTPNNTGGFNSGHRYSRSVPAPSLLSAGIGDLKSIWSDHAPPVPVPTASGLPMVAAAGAPSTSYSSNSGLSSSFTGGDGIRGLSPSNASAAFLPGIHHYIAQNKARAAANGGANGNGVSGGGLLASNAAHQQQLAHYLQSGPSGLANTNPNSNSNNTNPSTNAAPPNNSSSAYIRPNPFDLTQQLHNPSLAGGAGLAQQGPYGLGTGSGLTAGGGGGDGTGIGALTGGLSNISLAAAGGGDGHILSPNARALQAHAPGQSLPQGLAAGYSRIHALPPLANVGSPSPAGVTLENAPREWGVWESGSRDWATMSTGSISGSPGFLSFMPSAKPAASNPASNANNNANNTAASNIPTTTVNLKAPPVPPGLGKPPTTPGGTTGLESFSRLSYSAAAAASGRPGPPGVPLAAAPMQRNPSSGSATGGRWAGGAPLSPLSGPVMTRDTEDDLFALDE